MKRVMIVIAAASMHWHAGAQFTGIELPKATLHDFANGAVTSLGELAGRTVLLEFFFYW